MEILINPLRGQSDAIPALRDVPMPSVDASRAQALVARCPKAAVTPLVSMPELANLCRVGDVLIKDERNRMGLGSFKSLGAAYVIAHDAIANDLRNVTYVAASAGNHGLSVAAGAGAFGARAVIYIAQTVPESFATRLREQGAKIVRQGATYEQSMAAAAAAAAQNNWQLLSDSSWPGYFQRPHRLMEGYLVLVSEMIAQMPEPPSHIFLQAGVGGLAGAVAALVRHEWGDGPRIIVVEPAAAPALAASIAAAGPVRTDGPVSCMGRLDCKEPSLIALRGLVRDADFFATITEDEGAQAASLIARLGLASTPSGAAGLAGLCASAPFRDRLGLEASSRVALILSEGPEQ